MTSKRIQRMFVRDERGWGLAGTLIMMVVIGIFLSTMWAMVVPTYLHVMSLRYRDMARAVNEGAMDNLLGQINDSMYSPPTLLGQTQTLTSKQTVGSTNFAISNSITNLGSGGLGTGGPPMNSILYSSSNPATNVFYSLTSNATTGLLTKQISVVLAAVPPSNANGLTLQQWQLGGAFGVTTVNEVGLACINGYNLPPGWGSPYQFADTTVAKGIHWQIGTQGNTDRSQVIAGNQFEFWHPGDSPPAQPPGTIACTYEPFTQIMGNVYSNYTDQQGGQGNGYWARNQSNDWGGGSTIDSIQHYSPNGNVFGALNGSDPLGTGGVPSGYQMNNGNTSIPIPPYSPSSPTLPVNGGSSVNPGWGYNGDPNTTGNAANLPQAQTSNGGGAYQSSPYTGGYITSPGNGPAGTADTWQFPAPPTPVAPGAPVGAGSPATGGLGVPNNTGTYFASAPQNVRINGGTVNITSSAAAPPSSLSVGPGESINIPPGNYSISSLQVVNGGKITIDPSVEGQTQFFLNPSGTGQGTAGAVYVDNTSSINMTGINGGNGFTPSGQKGFGDSLPNGQPAVNTASPITETSGSCLNLVINTNASCNMLFAGNQRMIVNAPKANVNVGYQPYNGTQYTTNSLTDPSRVMRYDANFYGSIVGNNVSIVSDYNSGAGAYLHYDVKLRQIDFTQNPPNYGKALNYYDPWMFGAGGASPTASQWRAVTWQEQLRAW